MKLGELIVDYRTKMSISQREFSRRCDLSNSYISFLEKGINPKTGKPLAPTIEQYKKIARGMSISLQRLFELLDEDAPVDISFPPSDPGEYSGDDPLLRRHIIETFINAVYVFEDHLDIVTNNCEGNHRFPLADLPAEPDPDSGPECSDSVSNGVPSVLHPNTQVTIFRIAI